MIKTRLTGEALKTIEGLSFTSIREFTNFLERRFDETKTTFQEVGALADCKQKRRESVVHFSNKIKDCGKRAVKAAFREKKQCYVMAIDSERLKHFIRGWHSEIRIRMPGFYPDLDAAIEEAIEIEEKFKPQI